MTKKELIKAIAEKAELTTSQATAALDATLEAIKVSVVANDEAVQLIGFGTFQSKEKPAREGINPATKEKIQIPARKVATFKPSKQGWF